MQSALSFDSVKFGALLRHPNTKFVLNLEHATLEEVLVEYENFKRKTRPKFSTKTIRTVIKMLEDEYGIKLMPIQITDDFYQHFIAWNRTRHTQYNTPVAFSTIEQYCCNIQCALKWASAHNCRVSSTFNIYDVPKYEKTKIALTPDQISHIYHFDLHSLTKIEKKIVDGKYVERVVPQFKAIHLKTLDRVRDQFVLSCNLAQRYSDMKCLKPMHFENGGTKFRKIQQKTGNKAVVDILKYSFDKKIVRTILEKYDYTSPYSAEIGNYNHYLHELLRLIGGEFLEPVKVEVKVDGIVKTINKPLWQLITSHTARRTFITNNMQRGNNEVDVRRCSGHSDSRSFARYICYED